ncbi:MAG: Flp pilus assembly complex ATPase component, partial [Deltaproteobacteria bacterium]|nr:Flp pilus assembly complex ATPase component [Deltaproteobacteria bacterium]
MARQRKRLGDMLVAAELLNEEELTTALRGQRDTGLLLGDYLIKQNIVSEEQIIDLLSEQLQIRKFDDGEFEITPRLSQFIPNDISNKYKVIPLAKDDFVMTVATPDPMNVEALDFIEKSCDIELDPLICSNHQFQLLSNGIYGISSEVDDILGDIETDEEEDARNSGPDQNRSLQDAADDAPVVRLANSIMRQAISEKASDIHISPEQDYAQVRMRIDGDLHEIPPPPKSTLIGIISRIKILANMDITNTRVPQDGRFTIRLNEQEISIRVSTIPTIYGENLVMRLLFVSAGSIPLEDLGLFDDDLKALQRLAGRPYGMILSAGPTGSGKSSTLYALLRKIITPKINVITLEDPVEYRMAGARQVQLNTKAGMTFASGLRSILRQDPDVIMVGEIRDGETADIATQAALTGHLVLSSLHTNDSANAITRLSNMGIEPFLISASLLGVCAQRLLKKNCRHCLEDYQPSAAVK